MILFFPVEEKSTLDSCYHSVFIFDTPCTSITGKSIGGDGEGRRGETVCFCDVGFRCDVTGIAITNYAMFLFFFFQCGASRFARRVFSHAPEVPSGAYYRGIPRFSCQRERGLESFAQRGASPINDIRCENGSDCYLT